jgi:adenylate cyclase
MGTEIERKFLVRNDAWRAAADGGTEIVQGYTRLKNGVLRVRLAGPEAFITLKGPTQGLRRPEFEFPIPRPEAEELLNTLFKPALIVKTRYRVPYAGKIWEVDVFRKANDGLTVAEVELDSEDEPVEIPEWAGPEISHDPRYSNAALCERPWSQWPD